MTRPRLRNQWKIDQQQAERAEKERNLRLQPEYDERVAARGLREGIERFNRAMAARRNEPEPPF